VLAEPVVAQAAPAAAVAVAVAVAARFFLHSSAVAL